MIAFYTSERQEYGMDNIIGLMGAMEDEIAPLAACMEAKENIPLGGITFTSGLLGGKKTVLCCAG